MSADGRRLGNRLKQHRARLGLTQGQLADAVSVSRRTVNSVENAVFIPSTELALRMAEALGVPVEELFFLGPREGGCQAAGAP
ncbi:MAG: transcriptional regulator, family [Alphaproteobacteria bacterium]|nr:transcriptional regulator, family [Alphaproteobacteria bacterium]